MRLGRRSLLGVWLLAGAVLGGCANGASGTAAAGVRLPAYASRSERVRTGYLFALSDGAVLEGLPCYCGCVDLGHTSLRSCFVKDSGGFDSHAAGCDVCVAEALDARRLTTEGSSTAEIRRQIDDTYGSGGRGTATPPPTAR